MRKQNLNLFFVENDSKQSITNNIIRSYMNGFIINEDSQSEVNGVFYFNHRQTVKG